MRKIEKFHITGSSEGVAELRRQIERVAKLWKVTNRQCYEINLILEEICVNVMEHSKGLPKKISIQLSLNQKLVIILVIDNGQPFDLTSAGNPDVLLPVEERVPGGLGVHLVKHYSSSIRYRRIKNMNILIIKKIIET